jgi:hypothetical protein
MTVVPTHGCQDDNANDWQRVPRRRRLAPGQHEAAIRRPHLIAAPRPNVSSFARHVALVLCGVQFRATLNLMEYRRIPYTIRAGIERGQWFVAIHPDEGVEVAGNKIIGRREDVLCA